MLTVQEMAERLRIAPSISLSNWYATARSDRFVSGRVIRIPVEAVDRFLDIPVECRKIISLDIDEDVPEAPNSTGGRRQSTGSGGQT